MITKITILPNGPVYEVGQCPFVGAGEKTWKIGIAFAPGSGLYNTEIVHYCIWNDKQELMASISVNAAVEVIYG